MVATGKKPPTEAVLKIQQLQLTNQKLEQDVEKAKAELRPQKWWTKTLKGVLSFGGVVTVLASAYGIYDSYTKTLTDREHTRVADAKSRIDGAIKQLDSGSVMSKLSSIATLGGYLDRTNQDLHRQIFYVFAAVMATEDDEQVQTSIRDFVSAIPTDGSIRAEDWAYFANTLASQSRELVNKGDLIAKHQVYPVSSSSTDQTERLAAGIGQLIAVIVRKGVTKNVTKFYKIYRVECDFSDAQFNDNTDFSDAILDKANFSRSTIRKANFDDAQLIGTIFVSSDLRGASIRSTADSPIALSRSINRRDDVQNDIDYYVAKVASQGSVAFVLPDFSCADLTDVDFSRRMLFPAGISATRTYPLPPGAPRPDWYANIANFDIEFAKVIGGKFRALHVLPPKFFKANVTGTNFVSTEYFALANKGADELKLFDNYTSHDISEFELAEGELSEIAFREPSSLRVGAKTESGDDLTSDEVKAAQEFQQMFFASFSGARNAAEAKLSANATALLSRLPMKGDYDSFLGVVTTRVQEVDCAPR